MKNCIIVGGSNGIGLSFLKKVNDKFEKIYVFDILEPKITYSNVIYIYFDLFKNSFDKYTSIFCNADCLIITAGIGRVDKFEAYSEIEIKKTINIDYTNTILLIKKFYPTLLQTEEKYCLIMGSMAGNISSPLFAIYGACKAGINKFIESVNIELEKSNTNNRITNIMPISFTGSSFNGNETNLDELEDLSTECINSMFERKTELYPNNQLCKDIFTRYLNDKHAFGLSSYDYKINNNRLITKTNIKIGYLSGTFDLFHIGHLNLLKRAKEYCDYLIVGVHKDASHKGKTTFISFDERKEIVKSIKYVDEVIESTKEDSDAWNILHYDLLFVGSDYKGTERFIRYEKYFEDKNVKIIYFPYTKGTSSTQLRSAIEK